MDNKKEQLIAVIFSIVGSLAILINLTIKGFSAENLLDAVKDLVGLLVTIAIFLVAYSISNKSRSFLDAGKTALDDLKKRNSTVLQGPEFDKTDYNPEESSKSQRMQYLFLSKYKYSKKVAFIPLEPIDQGILDIRISKATLVNLGHDTADPLIESLINEVQTKIFSSLSEILKSKYNKLFEILNERGDNKDQKYKNSAIVIDFDENQLKIKGLKKAIYICSDKALQIVLTYKK